MEFFSLGYSFIHSFRIVSLYIAPLQEIYTEVWGRHSQGAPL